MATSYEDFLKTVNPSMLGANGRFLGANAGVNYAAEGQTPEQFFQQYGGMHEAAGAIDGSSAPQQQGDLSLGWRPGATSTGARGEFWGSLGAALGGTALAGGFSGAAGAGEGLATAGGGATGAAGDFGAGTYAAGAAPGAAELSPLAAQTITPGASAVTDVTAGTAATGAGAGTAATGAASAAGGGFSSALSPLIGTAVKGLLGGAINNALSPNPQKALDAADPFNSQRAQYQPQFQSMMQGKFDPTDPSYQFRFEQGQKATERALGASGMGQSGNAMMALTQYGQGMASTEYQNQYARLAQLSGANAGAGAAGGIAQNQANAQTGQASAVTNGIMNFGQGLYDNWNSSVGSTPQTGSTAPGGANFGMDLGFGD